MNNPNASTVTWSRDNMQLEVRGGGQTYSCILQPLLDIMSIHKNGPGYEFYKFSGINNDQSKQ
jgi:hypothetical protein